jgi:hypothetical protein
MPPSSTPSLLRYCALPGWQLPCRTNAERDDDDESFHTADGADELPVGSVGEVAPVALPHEPEWWGDEWKGSFRGTWRLETHREDYDRWLSLKVGSALKRRVAASLPATKRFVLAAGHDRVTHVYTLASTLELTQVWNMTDPNEWREEVEAGSKCLVSSSWAERSLLIRKQFPKLGLTEEVLNTISPDGEYLVATMRTTVVATGETRSTCDRFHRVS